MNYYMTPSFVRFWIPGYCPQRFGREPTPAECYPQQGMMLRSDPSIQPYSCGPLPDFYLESASFGSRSPFFPQQNTHPDYFAAYRQAPIHFQFPQKSSSTLIRCEWINETGKECGMMFATSSQVAAHVSQHHIGLIEMTTHVCLWRNCDRVGKPPNTSWLITYVFTPEKNRFVAKQCNREFARSENLKIHVRTHTKEKPFPCPHAGCDKTFANSSDRKKHMHVHTSEKPYECKEKPFPCPHAGCDKTFANSSDRKKHMHVHTSEKPYECKVKGCKKVYSHPSSLRKHMKAHEKNCLTPELDESSDSGHASTGTPGDPFLNMKPDVNEMSLQFPSNTPLIRPPVAYGPPPHYAPSHHPAAMFPAELYHQFH
ncbi:zinc finger, C2H2 type [Ostertagia ostertagi]